jgi:hypothetical protein
MAGGKGFGARVAPGHLRPSRLGVPRPTSLTVAPTRTRSHSGCRMAAASHAGTRLARWHQRAVAAAAWEGGLWVLASRGPQPESPESPRGAGPGAGPGPGYRTPAADAARHLTASERGPRSAFEEATAFSEGDAGDLPASGGRAVQTSTSKERKCRKDGSPPDSLGMGKPHQLARQCSFDSSADDQSRGRSQATSHVPRAWSLLVKGKCLRKTF